MNDRYRDPSFSGMLVVIICLSTCIAQIMLNAIDYKYNSRTNIIIKVLFACLLVLRFARAQKYTRYAKKTSAAVDARFSNTIVRTSSAAADESQVVEHGHSSG